MAANLQFFTLPMEIIGFALALIEVRFPKAAQRLARFVAGLAEPIARIRASGNGGPGGAADQLAEAALERSLKALLTRVITIGLVVVVIYFLVGLLIRASAGGATLGWAVGEVIALAVTSVFVVVALVVVSLAVYFSVTAGSDFIQRFVAGRAVGTLGILIAGIGVLGECYQLATYMLVGG
ncbi:MAG: hypothetical protein RIC56_11800 [Pseudomonadales bacterium]